jgi:hypothetical protein
MQTGGGERRRESWGDFAVGPAGSLWEDGELLDAQMGVLG